jgi:hypothetical protein
MKVFTITMTTLAAAAIGFAGNASASATSVDSAVDTIQSLQASGYNVQINGSENVPLSECRVIGIHGLPSGAQTSTPIGFNTVYVDVSCPSDN